MKGKRLADVLDNYTTPPKSKLGDTILKLVKLVVAIETKKGPQMNMDDHDYRWAKDRLEYMEEYGRRLTKDDMERANELWRIYGS